MVRSCWKPSVDGDDGDGSGSGSGRVDGLLWYKDLGNHLYGDFSMAVVQANSSLEDRSELESGPLSSNHFGPQGTFIGVYDGHGGAEASQFVSDNLFCNLKRLAGEHQGMSENVIRKAFSATEAGFLSLVKRQWLSKPHFASAGTCCLVGIICNGMIYIANSGDSRVVLGRVERATRETSAVQLSTEHNVNQESIRDELRSKHPYDPQIVVMRHNVWRVKGLIQVSRSIGDVYLKKAEFNREPLPTKYRLAETFFKPILSSEPSISSHKLHHDDQFLIFASDGLWEHLSNQEAVNIVTNNPPNIIPTFTLSKNLSQFDEDQTAQILILSLPPILIKYMSRSILIQQLRFIDRVKGIARRLVKAALREAARKREMRLSDLQKIEQGVRRHFHDDITVIVVFLNHKFTDHSSLWGSPLTIKGGGSANY